MEDAVHNFCGPHLGRRWPVPSRVEFIPRVSVPRTASVWAVGCEASPSLIVSQRARPLHRSTAPLALGSDQCVDLIPFCASEKSCEDARFRVLKTLAAMRL